MCSRHSFILLCSHTSIVVTPPSSVTIQCYLYNDNDNIHYENFDYIGGDNEIHQFVPDSDWDFGTFREIIRKEWGDYLSKAHPEPKMTSKWFILRV